jgi:hypothetical protein
MSFIDIMQYRRDQCEPTIEQKLDTAYVFKLSKTNDWEVTTTIDPRDKSNHTFSSRKNRKRLHAHGNFGGFGGGQVSFSGTQNNRGPTEALHLKLLLALLVQLRL